MKMKKILILASAVILAALTSCTKEYNTYNEYYEYHYSSGASKTVLFHVKDADWEYIEGDYNMNCCFRATVNMPEITADILKTGLVKMYRVFDYGLKSETQMEMPYIRHNEYTDNVGALCFYTETLDYEFSDGLVSVFFTRSDFMYEDDVNINPKAMDFRCVIM